MSEGVKINQAIFKCVLQLLERYNDTSMTTEDFLQLHDINTLVQDENVEAVIEIFLSLVQHKHFIEDITNYFYCLGKRKDHSDRHALAVMIHFIISKLNMTNKDGFTDILLNGNLKKAIHLLQFFNRKSIIEELFLAGCKYFEETYVKERIVSRIKNNSTLLHDLLCYMKQLIHREDKVSPDVAEFENPALTVRLRSFITPPNTPQDAEPFRAKAVPKSIYRQPKIKRESKTSENKSYEKNVIQPEADSEPIISKHEKQENNLFQSEVENFAFEVLPTLNEKENSQEETENNCASESSKIHPHHKIVVKNYVPVKKNAASILREAFRLLKEEEKEKKRLNELVCGASNYKKYEDIFEQLRAYEERVNLENIEKKHLNGLLTREEAILAKQKLLKSNKCKKEKVDQEKKEIEQILKQMRQKQDEEIKKIIEMTQDTKRNVEIKKREILDKKQKTAQEVAITNKLLYEEATQRQKEEMERRMEIIKEIKALSNIKTFQTNVFDPTETMNIGLLCEMSIAELHERLLIKRASVKEEIENKQAYIREQRLKQQQFLFETEEFIKAVHDDNKIIKETNLRKREKSMTKAIENQDILKLRNRLQEARNKTKELRKK